MASGAGTVFGRGGMLTKVLAAKRAARSGASTVIAGGRLDNVLSRLAAGEAIGTELVAETMMLAARKQWPAHHLRLARRLPPDAGAVPAPAPEGQNPLPVRRVTCQGPFQP